MVLELATILLGAGLGIALVLYAAPRGYFGHPRRRVNSEVTEYRTTQAPAGQERESPSLTVSQQTNPDPIPSPAQEEVKVVAESDQPKVSDTQVTSIGAGNVKSNSTVRRRAVSRRSTSRRRIKQQ